MEHISSNNRTLSQRQYISCTYGSCTTGTYTSGTSISQSNSYPHMFIVNVSGLSGTLSVSISGGLMLTIGAVKDDTATILYSGDTSSKSVSFSDYDFLCVTGATGGGRTMTIKITE